MFVRACTISALTSGVDCATVAAARLRSAVVSSSDDTESVARLKNAQLSFDDASSQGRTAEERALHAEILSAMASPSKLGTPPHEMPAPLGSCQQDFTACPVDWRQKGTLCYADASYSGPCNPVFDPSDMGDEQKFAYARQCKVDFPCQGECALDFKSPCPSSWRETSQGTCVAPSTYTGECSSHIDARGMTNADKQSFGIQCGARWPCLGGQEHEYTSTCPNGWTLQPGQTCNAPDTYTGPCDKVAYMGSMTTQDKKEFEASCQVSWPVA